MEGLKAVTWNGNEFHTLAPEVDLLHRLTGRPDWDPVLWQVDVLMMSFAGVDWRRFRNLADAFNSFLQPVDVIERLMELRREWQLPIPEIGPLRCGFFPDRGTPSRTPLDGLRSKFYRWRSLLWRA